MKIFLSNFATFRQPYSWSHGLAAICDQRSNVPGCGQSHRFQSETQHTVSCVPGLWSAIHQVPRDSNTRSTWYDVI